MFLQIHTLTSYAAALLNRDDAGLAKRIPFGNAERMRVSSQCLKKHWRDDLRRNLALPGGIRSRMFFEREVLRRVLEAGVNEEQARAMTEALLKKLVKGGQDKNNPLQLNQPVLFGKPEADFFVKLICESAASGEDPVQVLEKKLEEQDKKKKKNKKKLDEQDNNENEEKSNLKALIRAAGYGDLYAGIEGALFGRFVTSDILARSDAAVHVAHAFTVHPIDTEVDYFTVVDDLKEDHEDARAAHAGEMELGAGLFYGYVVVDVPLLVSNLSGCDAKDWKTQPRETLNDARNVLERLIDAIATVSPGAKLGATAPYARAACVLLETGNAQPRTLANAYLKALKLNGDPMQQAVDSLGVHLASIDAMYGPSETRFISTTQDASGIQNAQSGPLNQTIAKAMDSLFGAA